MKQIAIHFFKFYIHLNFHVATSVVSLLYLFNNNVNNNYSFFVFFSTVLSYNIIRIYSFGGNRYFIKRFFAQFKKTICIIICSVLILSLYYYFSLSFQTQYELIPLFIITFLYNLDYKLAFIPNLRKNGILKIVVVGIVWSGIVVVIPMINNSDLILHDLLTKSLFVFFYIILLTLSFDQRDILIDATDLQTIPQLFPKFLIIINIGLGLILILLSSLIFSNYTLIISLIFIVLSTILCIVSSQQKSFYYTAFWIEALPIFWLIILNL